MNGGKNIVELQSGAKWAGNAVTFSFLESIPNCYTDSDYEDKNQGSGLALCVIVMNRGAHKTRPDSKYTHTDEE